MENRFQSKISVIWTAVVNFFFFLRCQIFFPQRIWFQHFNPIMQIILAAMITPQNLWVRDNLKCQKYIFSSMIYLQRKFHLTKWDNEGKKWKPIQKKFDRYLIDLPLYSKTPHMILIIPIYNEWIFNEMKFLNNNKSKCEKNKIKLNFLLIHSHRLISIHLFPTTQYTLVACRLTLILDVLALMCVLFLQNGINQSI